MKRTLLLAVGASLLAAFTGSASATTTYSYTGLDFTSAPNLKGPVAPATLYTMSDRVAISFTLDGPLAANLSFAAISPAIYSFSDGVGVVDNGTASGSGFFFTTDASGTITDWFADAFITTTTAPFRQHDIGSLHGGAATLEDFGEDTLCSPASTKGVCINFGDGWYDQSGTVLTFGTWTSETSATVPEPATGALMIVGVGVGIGFATRRRRNSARLSGIDG